jgi:hypothetical protein
MVILLFSIAIVHCQKQQSLLSLPKLLKLVNKRSSVERQFFYTGQKKNQRLEFVGA